VDWTLFLLGLVEVLIGGFISQSDRMGLMLILWAMVSLWTLGLFHLDREAKKNKGQPAPAVWPTGEPVEPYPGLLDVPFVISAARVAGTTLALGGLIFLAMPRWGSKAGAAGAPGSARHLTGFTDEVQLGQIGEILENDSVVMNIELFDERGNRVEPSEEPLWRGVAMQTYNFGRWFREQTFPLDLGMLRLAAPARSIRQLIKLESSDSDVLFGLRPVWKVVGPSGSDVKINEVDGTIYRHDLRPDREFEAPQPPPRRGPFEYEVYSEVGGVVQPGETYPSAGKINQKLLGVPNDLLTELQAISDPIVAKLGKRNYRERARVLEQYLLGSDFSYSLRMEVVDRSIDPVLDFLKNRKQGHCEYFASALTLLLRSQGIPARLVNGFKGGDWSALGRFYTVRQKHAHSWVEALVSEDPAQPPQWLTLDPTPAQQRDQSIARVDSGLKTRLRPVSDYARYLWTFYVVGFNDDRQERLIYRPVRQLIDQASRGFRLMWQAIRTLFVWSLEFENLQAFFSVKGFFVSTIAMLALVGLLRAGRWLWRRLAAWYRGGAEMESGRTSGVAVFSRLVRILSQVGLERPPAETPREFAQRSSLFLSARDDRADGIAEVPPHVVDAFYQIRFGHLTLSPDSMNELERRLDALEANLRKETG
jgi:transglutaminase-like putative cysteine protease